MINTDIFKKAVIQALIDNEYQDNTNYNDIADFAVENYKKLLIFETVWNPIENPPQKSGQFWVRYKDGKENIASYNKDYLKWLIPGHYYYEKSENLNIALWKNCF